MIFAALPLAILTTGAYLAVSFLLAVGSLVATGGKDPRETAWWWEERK